MALFAPAAKVTTAPSFEIGDVIAGKYRIDQILGAGGMGVVVAARHLLLDDVVAIKFLSAELSTDANAVGRFDREARAAAKVKSEHIARVFDVDRLPNGVPYMVMEYLQGADLSTLIDAGQLLPEPLVATFVIHACAGLAEAHRAGIVHRDIKPSNLFCVGRWDRAFTIKVLDFGISKLTLTSDSVKVAITGTGAALGSPAYMSPEQMRSSANVDSRTDIWSLGVVLYELATSKLPFNGTSYPELCLKIAGDAPTSPRVHRPQLSPDLEAIIARCLEKEREHRFQTVTELAEALLPLAPGNLHLVERMRAIAAHDHAPSAPPATTTQVSTLPLVTPAVDPALARNPITDATWTATELPPLEPRAIDSRRRKLHGVGAGLGLGVVLSVAVVIWARSGHDAERPPPLSASAAVPSESRPSPEPPAPIATSAPPVTSAPPIATSAPSTPNPHPTPRGAVAPPPSALKAFPSINPSPKTQRSKSAVWNQRD